MQKSSARRLGFGFSALVLALSSVTIIPVNSYATACTSVSSAESINAHDCVKLTEDINEPLTITSEIELDLNSHTINGTIAINSGASLSLVDGTQTNGTVKASQNSPTIINNGTLKINDGVSVINSKDNADYSTIKNNGTIYVTNGAVVRNEGSSPIISVTLGSGKTITISGGSFTGKTLIGAASDSQDTPVAGDGVVIEDGNFTGITGQLTEDKSVFNNAHNGIVSIRGGIYNQDPKDFVKDTDRYSIYTDADHEGQYAVGARSTITVSGDKIVKLGGSAAEVFTLTPTSIHGITNQLTYLDADGKEYTSDNSYLTVDAATSTFTAKQTGSHIVTAKASDGVTRSVAINAYQLHDTVLKAGATLNLLSTAAYSGPTAIISNITASDSEAVTINIERNEETGAITAATATAADEAGVDQLTYTFSDGSSETMQVYTYEDISSDDAIAYLQLGSTFTVPLEYLKTNSASTVQVTAGGKTTTITEDYVYTGAKLGEETVVFAEVLNGTEVNRIEAKFRTYGIDLEKDSYEIVPNGQVTIELADPYGTITVSNSGLNAKVEGNKFTFTGTKEGTYTVRFGSIATDPSEEHVNVYRDVTIKVAKQVADIDTGVYTIKSALGTNMVLDIDNASEASGRNVQLYGGNGTVAQKFLITKRSDGYYTIQNIRSSKVLDVAYATAKSGTNVWQYDANGTKAQAWLPLVNANGTITFVSALDNNLVLDVSGASTRNGANIQVYSNNYTQAQQFTVTKDAGFVSNVSLDSATYTVASNLASSMVLDIDNASKNSGANLQLYTANGTGAQQFKFTQGSDGMYTITNVQSGKVLDVAGAGIKSGTNVQQYDANGTNAQKWVIIKSGDTYSFRSLSSGLYLDVSGAHTKDRTNIQVYTGNGTKAQQFTLK